MFYGILIINKYTYLGKNSIRGTKLKKGNNKILSIIMVIIIACAIFFGGCNGINGFDNKTFEGSDTTPTIPEKPPVYDPPETEPEEEYIDYSSMFTALEDDAIAAIVLSYKLNYQNQLNTTDNSNNIKQQVSITSEAILEKLVQKYGDTQETINDNLLINLKKDNFAFLNISSMTEEQFVNKLPGSHIMEMPTVTESTFNTVIPTRVDDNNLGVSSSMMLQITPTIAPSVVYNDNTFTFTGASVKIAANTTTLTAPTYSFMIDQGQAYNLTCTYTNDDTSDTLSFVYSSTALDSIVSLSSSLVQYNGTTVTGVSGTVQLSYSLGSLKLIFNSQTIIPGSGITYKVEKIMGNVVQQGNMTTNNYTVTLTDPIQDYGVYRIEFDTNVYFVYYAITDNAQRNLAMDNTIVKDTHFDAINNGWSNLSSQVINAGWLWDLDNSNYLTFKQDYIEKYSKLLQINIYKILLLGYGEDFSEMPDDFQKLYDGAVLYANGDNTKESKYNEYVQYCCARIDHIGFTPYDCDQIAEYVLNFVIGQNVVNAEMFNDKNANGTFDANESFDDITLNLITGNNNPNADYRFNKRSEEWSKFEYTGTGMYQGDETRGNYFKNYVNTVYYCVYNSVIDAIPIVVTKFVGNIEDLSVFDDAEEEEVDENADDVDLDEEDAINMEYYGDLQSLIIIPNDKKFEVSNLLHYIELYIAAPEPVPSFSEILNIMLQYNYYDGKEMQKDNYVLKNIVEDNEIIVINSMLEPFNTDKFATGNTVNDQNGKSYTEYAFEFNSSKMANVKYIKQINGIYGVYSYSSGVYNISASNIGSITVDGVKFVYNQDTNTMIADGYVLYPNADGYFPFVKSTYYADNRFGSNSMAIIDTDYECLQVLFNSQQSDIIRPKFAVSVLGVY